MKSIKNIFCILIGLFLFSACTFDERPQWEVAIDGIETRSYDYQLNEEKDVDIVLYRFKPEDFKLEVQNSDEAKFINEWGDSFAEANLLINGFYFNEDHSPSGFLMSNEEEVGGPMFDLDKSGMILLSPEFKIIDTGTGAGVLWKDMVDAGQSYPFFFKDGKEAISEDSGLLARRSFIGTDMNGYVYFGIVPRDRISLYELMKGLDEMNVLWDDVINLDGGPSSGIVVKEEDYYEIFNSQVAVPNVITMTRK